MFWPLPPATVCQLGEHWNPGIHGRLRRAARHIVIACAAVSLSVLVAPVARGDEPPAQEEEVPARTGSADLLVRPILGVGFGFSGSGGVLDAQLGLRVSPILLRLSLNVGGTGGRGFVLAAAHGDWVVAPGDALAAFVGLGCGNLTYGFLLDNPVHSTMALLPEAGLIFGERRGLGRIILSLSVVLPLSSPPHTLSPGDQIDPPGAIGSLAISL